MIMLDLFSGTGSASAVADSRGWRVIRVDIDPRHRPTLIADVRALPLRRIRPDLLWASPPCVQYSRADKPWFPDEPIPDHSCLLATLYLVHSLRPTYWIIENVRGAATYLGPPSAIVGSFWLWDFFPDIGHPAVPPKGSGPRTDRAIRRATIPRDLAEAVCNAIETQPVLLSPHAP